MGFLDDVREEQETKPKNGPICHLCRLLKEWPQADAEDLAKALADQAIHASTLVRVLRRRGEAMTESKVGNHRREHTRGWRP